VSLAVLIVGALIAIPALVVLVVHAVHAINPPSVTTPGTTDLQLGTGTWYLFERTGETSGGAGFTFNQNNATTLDPGQVTITGPDGTALPATFVSDHETITKGSRIYTAALQFHVPTAGRFTIQLNTSGPGVVLIARPLTHTFRALAVPFVLTGFGGAVAVVGLVLLIVGSVRRSRVERPAMATPSTPFTPPGWYPDPQRTGAQRYWDGRMWTDHHT
jgi:hypothetical protein